jgi:hypothetical protein
VIVDLLLWFVLGCFMVIFSVTVATVLYVVHHSHGWGWIVKRRDDRSLTFFRFLNVTLGCFPWQESQSHMSWRNDNKRWAADKAMVEHLAKYEPKYPIGWRSCGDSFYRAIGFKMTSRDVRLDVWIGIIWISWLPFNPTKPRI